MYIVMIRFFGLCSCLIVLPTPDVTGNLIDGLLENEVCKFGFPSLAERWTVSKDGLTYATSFERDAKWYTSDGEEYAEVKSSDFVTGLKRS